MKSLLSAIIDGFKQLTPKKAALFLILIFLLVNLLNGVTLVSGEQYQRLSQNPFTTRLDIDKDNYWQESVLLPLFAHVTHLDDKVPFNILCYCIFVLAFLLLFYFTFKKIDLGAAALFISLLITSPLSTVILCWIGTPDSLTFLLTVPFLFINANWALFVLALLGATNHIMFSIAVIEIMLLRWLTSKKIKPGQIISTIMGSAFGFALVKLFLFTNQIQIVASRFEFILDKGLAFWVNINLPNFPLTLFSLFNVHWLILLTCLILFFKRDKRYYTGLLVLLVINGVITFFTLDSTRVFSLLSWGILFHCLLHSYELARECDSTETCSLQQKFLNSMALILILSFILPRFLSWEGRIYPSPFFYSLLHRR